MSKVYCVGVLKLNIDETELRNERLWYFFASFDDAEACVLQNQCDIFEDWSYNIALIEEHNIFQSGDIPHFSTAKQWWYKIDWTNGGVEPQVVKSKPPECAKNIVNFFAG